MEILLQLIILYLSLQFTVSMIVFCIAAGGVTAYLLALNLWNYEEYDEYDEPLW